jgi:hypothetical protein
MRTIECLARFFFISKKISLENMKLGIQNFKVVLNLKNTKWK